MTGMGVCFPIFPQEQAQMAKFPERAKVVIIGQGGIVGASVVHHLIERGWDNIVGIDKSAIPTDVGSTAHASDFCFNTMHDPLTIFTTRYSIDFYERWAATSASAAWRWRVSATTSACRNCSAAWPRARPSATGST
jgi:glycine/D-amino acid oxidase-like deaminating enzyme